MKKCFCSLLILLLTVPLLSQRVNIHNQIFRKKNSINLELGGYALGSIYFERILINQKNLKTTGQIGCGLLGLPVTFHQLVSFNNHHLELGLGVVLPIQNLSFANAEDPFITGLIGYRLQQPGRNFIFRAGLSHIRLGAESKTGPDMILWVFPGISYGYSF
jgi:hypothetical protein